MVGVREPVGRQAAGGVAFKAAPQAELQPAPFLEHFSTRRPRILHITEATEAGVASFMRMIARHDRDCTMLLLQGRTPTENLQEAINRLDVAVKVVSLRSVWRCMSEVRRLVRDHDAVVLHSGIAGALGRLASLAGVLAHPALVYAPHLSMGHASPSLAIAERTITMLSPRAHVMFVSKSEQSWFCARFGRRERSRNGVVHPFVELPATWRSEVAIDRRQPLRLVTVGRIAPQKSPERVAALLNQLARHGRTFRFRWVGDGPLREDFIAALTPEVRENTTVTGWTQDVAGELQRYVPHFFVLLSRYEGLPVAMIEAMANGIPVIASDTVGNSDVVDRGMNGLFYHPDSFIGDLEGLMSQARYTSLRHGARMTAAQYSAAAFAREYDEFFRRVVETSATGA